MGFDERDGYIDGETGLPGFHLVEMLPGDYSDSRLKNNKLTKIEPYTEPILPCTFNIKLLNVRPHAKPLLLFTGVQYNKETKKTEYFFAYEPPLTECKISRVGRGWKMGVEKIDGRTYLNLMNIDIKNLYEVSGLEGILKLKDGRREIHEINWQPIFTSDFGSDF